MPLRLDISWRARRDFNRILDYIARQNGDVVIARRFGCRLIQRCRELKIAPGAGSPVSIGTGVRKINEGAYKIYYRIGDDEVIVLRIWDGRRGSEPRL